MSFGLCGGVRGGAIIQAMISESREHHRLLRWGGLAVWLGVGLPIWMQLSQTRPERFAGWLPAWLLFAVAFWVTAGDRAISRKLGLALLGLQTACVMILVLLLCDGFEGTLL